MGLNFFHQYYTVFDQEERRLGFAPSIHADARLDELIENGAQSYIQMDKLQDNKQAILLAFGGFALLAIAGYTAVKMVKKNSNKQVSGSRKEYKAMNAS